MTTEEKVEKIEEYCNNVRCNSNDCVLYDAKDGVCYLQPSYMDDKEYEKLINQNYATITGEALNSEKAATTEDEISDTKADNANQQTALKHLKGYMYDSLVYRFQLAQAKSFEAEARTLAVFNPSAYENLDKARGRVRDMQNRDLIRFCQILDEAIGEHD